MKLKPLIYSAASLITLSLVVGIGIAGRLFTVKVYSQDVTQPPTTPTAGTERTGNFGIKQVYVPVGCFMMGSTDAQAQDTIAQYAKDGVLQSEAQNYVAPEQPQHQVCITKNYWLDEFDVTNAAFDAFVKAGGYSNDSLWSTDGLTWKQSNNITGPIYGNSPAAQDCTPDSSQPNQPRVCVSYYEAEAYAAWRGARLPTEAEWEYAARGPNDWIYPWGNGFDQRKANTIESGINKTTAVDAYPTGRSWVGAFDMVGNVFQWVSDWYDPDYYANSAINDPTGPTTNTGSRVLRGSSWFSLNSQSRGAARDGNTPGYGESAYGFRLVTDAASGPSTTPATTAPTAMLTVSTATATSTPTAVIERTDRFGIKQVYVPAGCFLMGTSDSQAQGAIAQFVKAGWIQSVAQKVVAPEQPQHKVCITKGYWLDEFDVTNAAFDAFVQAGGYSDDSLWSVDGLSWKQAIKITGPDKTCTQFSSQPNQPRVCVNYYEAEAYAKWRGSRLPSEAEWEYAARGPTGSIYPWGDTFDQNKANTSVNNRIEKTTAVDAYPSGNSWVGAYDMAGNVWQWVADWYSDTYYSRSPTNDPTGPSGGKYRVLRGGSFIDRLNFARSAYRLNNPYLFPASDNGSYGFRVVDGVPG